MIVLYILGGIIAFILLLLCVPMEVEVKYRESLELNIRYLFIPFQLFPKKPRQEKEPKTKAGKWVKEKSGAAGKWIMKKYAAAKKKLKQFRNRKKPQQKPEQTGKKKKKKSAFAELKEQRGFSGMLSLLWRVVKLATGAFRGVLRGLIVRRFDFFVEVCGEDAADTAVKYGELCSVLFPATAAILSSVRRYKRNIVIEPDFSGGATEADIHIVFLAFPILTVSHATAAFIKLLWLEISDKIKEKMEEASRQAENTMQGGVRNE